MRHDDDSTLVSSESRDEDRVRGLGKPLDPQREEMKVAVTGKFETRNHVE